MTSSSSEGRYVPVDDSQEDYRHHEDIYTDGNYNTPPKKRRLLTPRRIASGVTVIGIIVTIVIVSITLETTPGHKEHNPASKKPPNSTYQPPRCSHPIYCSGPLLKAVQLSNPPVFNDSKTFVDMPIRSASPAAVLDAFARFVEDEAYPVGEVPVTYNASATAALKAFIEDHFDPAGSEVRPFTPTDFSETPRFLDGIKDLDLRTFAKNVHMKWKKLVRQYNTTSYCDDCVSSLSLPHPFVVPGGRFREFYYWDSFWILKGLLVSELHTTALHVINNMLHLVKTFGFMPNGARRYYLDRSQPPLLTQIVDTFCRHNSSSSFPSAFNADEPTNCTSLVQTAAPVLVEEYKFWMDSPHYVPELHLNRFYAAVDGPRPESYREDYKTVTEDNVLRRNETHLFSDIAAGAETGWDFSTRWFDNNMKNMSGIQTRRVIPVDLNVILYQNEVILSKMYQNVLNDFVYGDAFEQAAKRRFAAIFETLWIPENCSFVDFDLFEKMPRTKHGFYISSLMPFSDPDIVAYVKKHWPQCITGPSAFHGGKDFNINVSGIPTSLQHSGQQWDFPNAWAPTEWFAMKALTNLANTTSTAKDGLHQLQQEWLSSNYCGYQQYQMMFEKYSAVAPGAAGHGGEYVVQDGFGWTNGVILSMLDSPFLDQNLTAPTKC